MTSTSLRSTLSLLPVLGALSGPAAAGDGLPMTAALPAVDLLNVKIDGLKALPISGLQMVKSGDRTFFLSPNGRFVFQGTVTDVWNQVKIETLEDVDRIANRIDLARMKLKLDDLGPVTYGTGREQAVVFVDPRCPYCAKVQHQMEALMDRYTFQLVSVPVLGAESQSLVVRLGCLLQTGARDQARDALMHQRYDGIPAEVGPDCDRTPMQKALVTAHLFGIDAVPFLIAPDGRTFKGAPDDLAGWLAGEVAARVERALPNVKGGRS